MRKVTGKEVNKIPSYLPVYNDLYEKIISGIYAQDTILPSEKHMADQYDVSRNTVRQALTILREDGLIIKLQGKGSIVASIKKDKTERSIVNPILAYSKCDIDHIDITYNFNPPTKIAMDRLNMTCKEIVIASNIVYLSKGIKIGHTFLQIPLRILKEHELDLNDVDSVSEFVNETIYTEAAMAKVSIKLTDTHDNIKAFLDETLNEPILYVEKILINDNEEPIGRFKYYLIDRFFDLTFVIQ